MGRNCVREVLRHAPQQVVKLLSSATSGGDAEIDRLAEQADIPCEPLTNAELSALVSSDSHQSYVALLKDRHVYELKEVLGASESKSRSLIVMVDTINDPQNFGAILRACECFGVDAVIWSKNRGVSVTPVVTKSSVGATELVPMVPVSNLGEALRKLKDSGYWVVAADAAADAQSIWSFEMPEKCVIIFGSEGEGIQRLLLENSDFKVAIPLLGRIDSLNVSQAVALFLFRYRQNHAFGEKIA
ncbi:MAG: 23S rRNA (guanosine(2251)-2'-O)-methyltransferase RlmB [Deltaproteobacteria bacterium]|nr:23S rRNA (guanosine(2251)-2'-O)-methyltransferase RlmB [Deltaproteobacteria bacterium]